jgi:hypothetical protein
VIGSGEIDDIFPRSNMTCNNYICLSCKHRTSHQRRVEYIKHAQAISKWEHSTWVVVRISHDHPGGVDSSDFSDGGPLVVQSPLS